MFNRQIPQLSGGELAELIQINTEYLCILNKTKNNPKNNTRARSMWDASSNLRIWFRGESIHSIDNNEQKCISDDTLLIHLNAAIASEHNTYFKTIFNNNQRLHELIKKLTPDQSAALLVKMCHAYRHHGNIDIQNVMGLMNEEAIKKALMTLKTTNETKPLKYLADRIKSVELYLRPTPIQTLFTHHPTFFTPTFFTPSTAAAAAAAAATITPLPDALPVFDSNMPDADELAQAQSSPDDIGQLQFTNQDAFLGEWTQPEPSLGDIDELQLTEADLQEWLNMQVDTPGLRM